MVGKVNVGYMQWGSQNVACSVHQWMQRESQRTLNGVGKQKPNICPSLLLLVLLLLPPRHHSFVSLHAHHPNREKFGDFYSLLLIDWRFLHLTFCTEGKRKRTHKNTFHPLFLMFFLWGGGSLRSFSLHVCILQSFLSSNFSRLSFFDIQDANLGELGD